MALSRRRVRGRLEQKRALLHDADEEQTENGKTGKRGGDSSGKRSAQRTTAGKRQKRRKSPLLSRVLTGLGLRKAGQDESASPDEPEDGDAVDSGRPKSRRQRGKRRNWATWLANAIEKTVDVVKSAVAPRVDKPAEKDAGSADGDGNAPDGGDTTEDDTDDNAGGGGGGGEGGSETADAPQDEPVADGEAHVPDSGPEGPSDADSEGGAEPEEEDTEADEPEVDGPDVEEDEEGEAPDGDDEEPEESDEDQDGDEDEEPEKPKASPAIRDAIRGGGMVGSSQMEIWITISSSANMKRVVRNNDISADKMMRWATIDAGRLPADDPTPRPLSEEEIKEQKDEAVKAVQERGRRKEEQIRDAASSEARMLIRRAHAADEEAASAKDADEARAARRRATRLRDQAQEVVVTRDQRIRRLTEQVDEASDQERARVQKEADKIQQRHDERLRELQRGLHQEVERSVQNDYFPGDDSVILESYYISDAETNHGK